MSVPQRRHFFPAYEIAQRRAAGADRRAQRVLDCLRELLALFSSEAARRFPRVDTCAEQALGCVDVADPDDAPAVHQELLDRRSVSAGKRVQALGVERA
jgi:hypothetical protein